MSNYVFDGMLSLITGAGSGMGRAVAKAFAEAGAKVVAADIDFGKVKETVKELKSGAEHIAVKVDVSDVSSVKDLATSIFSKYKCSPSIVVHAAGIVIIDKRKSIFDIEYSEWNRVIDVNLKGTFIIDKTFGQLMRDEKIQDGAIINFSSRADTYAVPLYADYCATKAGVSSLTKSFALELAPFNIRVNAVGPCAIVTPLFYQIPKHDRDDLVTQIPQKRQGQPEEVAMVCLFLASKDSSYMSGQTVYISGGL